MDMNEVRRQQLVGLIGDIKRRGAVANFARQHNLDATYLRQLISGHRGFGEKAARKMEKEIGLPAMYMDGASELSEVGEAAATFALDSPYVVDVATTVLIPRYDMAASMGNGYQAEDGHVDVVERIEVSRDYLRRTVRYSSPENLAIITALGDSMAPTFNDCDLLLIDRGINDINLDAVYVIHYEGQVFVKRIQRRPGASELLMISDNKAYEAQPISRKTGNFHVLGRVLMAWNARKL